MLIPPLDPDPTIAAGYCCDCHVVKLVLEVAQVLSTVAARHRHHALYRVTHRSHPTVLWAGDCHANWAWVCRFGLALAEEYRRRYGRTHASEAVIWDCANGRKGPVDNGLPLDELPACGRGYGPGVGEARRYYLNVTMAKDRCRWERVAVPWWARRAA